MAKLTSGLICICELQAVNLALNDFQNFNYNTDLYRTGSWCKRCQKFVQPSPILAEFMQVNLLLFFPPAMAVLTSSTVLCMW